MHREPDPEPSPAALFVIVATVLVTFGAMASVLGAGVWSAPSSPEAIDDESADSAAPSSSGTPVTGDGGTDEREAARGEADSGPPTGSSGDSIPPGLPEPPSDSSIGEAGGDVEGADPSTAAGPPVNESSPGDGTPPVDVGPPDDAGPPDHAGPPDDHDPPGP